MASILQMQNDIALLKNRVASLERIIYAAQERQAARNPPSPPSPPPATEKPARHAKPKTIIF